MSLQLISVHKHYEDKEVLRGIDLSIEKGTFLALLGPSGCGKTTLLHSIAGLTSISQGKIVVDDVVLSQPGKEVPIEKREIGMVFQDFALWPHMNVFEIVSFGLKLKGIRGPELKKKVLDTLGIFHMEDYLGHYPHELSGGQKQRIAMARAIAPNPRLILMDEPLSALDTGLREEMRTELVRIFKQLKMTVVYVTHDQGEAMSMADQIAILQDGLCAQMGAPEVLYNEPVSEYVAKFMGPANILPDESKNGVMFIRPDDVQLAAQGTDGLPGKVVMRSYLGSQYKYQIQLANRNQTIEMTNTRRLEFNEPVHILIPAEKCRKLQLV